MPQITTNDNVQATIDSSAGGSEIIFRPGTFNLTDIKLRQNRTYRGDVGAEINSSGGYAFKLFGDNIVIKSMTFNGPAIGSFDQRVSGCQITGSRFRGRNGNGNPVGVIQWACIGWNGSGSFVSSLIDNNIFDPIVNWTALYGYAWRDLTISRNTFKNRRNPANNTKTDQGRFIKLHGVGANANTYPEGKNNTNLLGVCEKLQVTGNWFTDFYGMAIEYQDGSANDVFEYNLTEKPIFISGNVNDHLDCYGFSVVAARSINLACHRNAFLLACDAPSNRERLAIELGGYNVICTQNLIRGPMGASIDMNGSNGSGAITSNRLENAPAPKAANGAKPTIANNGSAIALDWDYTKRYFGATWGGTGPATQPPTPPPDPPAIDWQAKATQLQEQLSILQATLDKGRAAAAATVEALK